MIIIIIPTTQSRTSWIAIVASSCLVIFIIHKSTLKDLLKRISLRQKILIILISLGSFLAFALGIYKFKEESANGRSIVWKNTIQSLKTNSIFGIGHGKFRYQYGNLKNTNNSNTDNVYYAFNDYLQMITENGILGLILFFLLIVTCIKHSSKSVFLDNSSISIAALSGLLSILISACFSYPFELAPTWLIFVFYITVLSNNSPIYVNIKYTPKLFILVVSIPIILIIFESKMINTKRQWYSANIYAQNGRFKNAIEIYDKIYDKIPNHPEILLEYGKNLYKTNDFRKSANILNIATTKISDPFLYSNLGDSYLKLKQYDSSEIAYKKSISFNSEKLYPKYLLAKMYLEKKDTVSAKKMAKTIINTKVEIPSPAANEIKKEMITLLSYKKQ